MMVHILSTKLTIVMIGEYTGFSRATFQHIFLSALSYPYFFPITTKDIDAAHLEV